MKRVMIVETIGLCSLISLTASGLSWAQVDTAWVRTYDNGSTDMALAITVDESCNVYVTGWSSDWSTGDDWATIKYTSSGTEEWVKRHNGPENSISNEDRARDIALDGSGNICVTGYVFYRFYDYGTIKYHPSGDVTWVRIYGSWVFEDATSIATDALDNVYVTGRMGDLGDYGTIKYDASGNEKWVATYAGYGDQDIATAIEVSDCGYVFVTGYSRGTSGSLDYATIKYDSSGNEQWVARYNGIANGEDRATAMAIDESGHTYVTGYCTDTVSDFNYATVKYDSSGNELWATQYNGPSNGDDRATAIVIDKSGSVYVTGYSMGSVSNYDYATIKYDSSGNEQWVARYNGPANGEDRATAMAIDDSGHIYVTGWNTGLGLLAGYCTIMYDSLGNELWTITYHSPGYLHDKAAAIAVDESGAFYVTGTSSPYSWLYWGDYTTIKYVSTTGISECNVARGIADLSILPNPCIGTVEICSSVSLQRVEIYNVAGRLVREERLRGHEQIHVISLENMNAGVYFLKLYATDLTIVRKLLVLN